MALKGNIVIKNSATYSETIAVGAIYYDTDDSKLKLCTNASGSGTWVNIN